MEELRSLVDQKKPLPNDTPAYQVTGIHLTASLEEACESMRTVLVMAQLAQKMLGTILNPASSTSSKTKELTRVLGDDVPSKFLISVLWLRSSGFIGPC
ncbi:hypothetical protein AHF37_00067 [Paragonimus kellicotti]|nr:hypothetical protein AHF37_00067 [Paragonimus kellicotti]